MFRLLSSWPATSSATFGRASKFAPTVPIGMRRSLTRRPFGSVHESASRSSGGELSHDRDLTHETVDAVVVEAQPVERPLVEAAGRGLVVGRIRGEDLLAPFADESGCNRERVGDGVVTKGRKRGVRGGRLGLDLVSESAHFTLYTARRQRGPPRSASREAEGPAL